MEACGGGVFFFVTFFGGAYILANIYEHLSKNGQVLFQIVAILTIFIFAAVFEPQFIYGFGGFVIIVIIGGVIEYLYKKFSGGVKSDFKIDVQEKNESLLPTEIAQLTLDYFWARNKTDAEIGKLYELYIGQLYEKNGYEVEYFGIEQGLNDLGRDLICHKDGHTWLVQCKNWSKSKTIHVKHIHQLFGTLAQYAMQHPDEQVHGAFFATTRFSPEALRAAESLKIQLQYCAYPGRFPIVKCKQDDNGKGVYYLPTDYQYDMVKLDLNKGDCYCRTVDEAESAGFQWIKFSTQ